MATKKKWAERAAERIAEREKEKEKNGYDSSSHEEALRRISQEQLRKTNNIEGESPYKNLYVGVGREYKEPKNTHEQVLQNINTGNYMTKAEREYYNSLPNDDYRRAYKSSKSTGGMYVSPYFSKGIEGKEKLKYNNEDWNLLSEAQRKKYLEWAQDDINKGKKEESSNKYVNYAKKIIEESQGGASISNSLGFAAKAVEKIPLVNMVTKGKASEWTSATTFDVDSEAQMMLQMLPEDIRNTLLKGYGLSENSPSRKILQEYFDDDTIDKLIKYGNKVGNIYKQQERNAEEEERMQNPFYATVVAPAKQIGLDLTVKPVAGVIDFYNASNELNKGIYGEYDPLRTEAQKMAQDARYINESINSGLGAGGQFVYGTAVSGAESAIRMYMANAGGAMLSRTMPFINAEAASKTLLTGMMSTAVFNDDLNENIQKGMPLEDAIGSAVAHSIFESLFEEISLDKLGYFQEAPVLKSKGAFVKQLLKAGVVEGSEEAFTDIANELYDHYVGNYDYSEYKAFKDNYLQKNPDANDAEVWKHFLATFGWQVAQSFAGGALSSFALSSTKGMDALRRGEAYIQNGQNVSDADYTRMLEFVTEMAAVNPSIRNQLAEAEEGGEIAKRGFVKMVADEYSSRFDSEIENAKTKDNLNIVMNNATAALNGAISEDTFNKYNAKLVELGESPADYKTFVQNRQKMGNTTFSELAYGRGDNAISRNIVEASKSIADTKQNANLSESERETTIKQNQEKIEQNVKKAEEMVARYAQMGVALDSPEVRQFESVLGLQNMAQLYSAGKISSENNMLSSVGKKSGTIKSINLKAKNTIAVLGKEAMNHVQAVPFAELKNSTEYTMAKALVSMTGANVEFYKSDRNTAVKNGAYDPRTNTFYFDSNAGVSGTRAAIGEVFSHELTHWMRANNEEGYQRLLDFVRSDVEGFDSLMKDKIARMKENGIEMDENVAQEELVAEACQRMLENSDTFKKYAAMDEEGAKNILQRLIDFIRKLRDAFKGSLNNEITGLVNDLEGLQQTWETALQEAIGEKVALEGGIDVETFEDTAVRDSIRTVLNEKESERVSKMLQEKLGVDKETADKYIENEQSIASLIFDNIGFLDYKPDDRYEAIKKNSDYPQGTVDMTNLCRKRAIFTQIFDSLQKAFPDKLFDAMDIAEIRQVLKDNGYEVACALCFVEDRRQRVGEIAENFIERLKQSNGKTLTVVNSKGETKELFMTKDLANTDVARRAGFKYKDAIKVTDKYVPTQYDLVTYEGFKALSENHPQIAAAFTRANNYLGMSSARLVEGRAEYKRDILKYTPAQVKRINNKGGLRIFSFSDFEAVHLLDICQVITDASAVGLKIQAYTKVPAFAKLVENTGIKLNRSLIASGRGFKEVNGKKVLTYDTHEGINIDDPDFFDSSDNPNIGNILVGISDEHIRLAMLDDFVDYIIPFHSNQGKNVLAVKGISHWTNYKEYQRERYADGRKGARDVNIYTQVIDKYNPANRVEFVEAFLQECEKQGKIPRFDQFLDKDENGKYVYTPGYEKLLLDFKLFDKQGNILPQTTVNPSINIETATKILTDEAKSGAKREKVSADIVNELEKKYEVKNSVREETENIAEESLQTATDSEKEILTGNDVRYSSRVTDKETLDFLENQDYITTYRSFQMINGGLYSPMNQGREGYKTELGVWEQATEIKDFDEAVKNKVLIPQKGGGYKYNLKSGNNTTSGKNRTTAAAYNPYLHSSNSVMNDQFAAAYDRPNLVVVECRVPKSEEARPYWAKNATDPVGWKAWKSGKASTELAKNGGEARGVFLSRWMKAVRVLSYEEVAQMYKNALEGTDITIQWNVVPPGLRHALEDIGIPIDYSYKNGSVTFENVFPDEAGKAKASDNEIRASERTASELDSEYMAAVESGDTETADMMVREAAIEAGYTSEKLYHGTSAFGFTEIDKKELKDHISFFATDSESVASTYSGTKNARAIADNGSNLGIYQLYANTDGMLELDAKGADSGHIELGKITKQFNDYYNPNRWNAYATARQIAKFAKANGYTGVIIRNLIDTATPETRDNSHLSSVYAFFDAKAQVKSADTVTYGSDGNIIPLSERFNKDSSDIRYSSRDSSGRELTEAQQEYFKDSKARDKDGNLLRLYHGSVVNNINVFNVEKTENTSGGIFMSTDRVTANNYTGDENTFSRNFRTKDHLANLYPMYANLVNPLIVDAMNRETEKYDVEIAYDRRAEKYNIRLINENGSKYKAVYRRDVLVDMFGEKTTEQIERNINKKIDSYKGNDFYKDFEYKLKGKIVTLSEPSIFSDIMFEGELVGTDDLVEIAKERGYDGLIVYNVIDDLSFSDYGSAATDVVAFSPEQVKLIDNENPTSSDDIRFSYRDLANSESEILVNMLKYDEQTGFENLPTQALQAYAKAYNELKEMEKQSIEYSKQLSKKGTTPAEREAILRKQVRLDRAILNKTTELTEMRNKRVIRDLLISEWDKRDTLIAAGKAEERFQTRQALEEKYGKELESLKTKSRAKQTEIRNRHEINKRKNNIIKKTKELMKMIQHPTEKKHIPSILVNPIVELLDGIDYWTPAEGRPVTKKSESFRNRFENFRSAINEYQKQIDEGTEQIELMFDPEFLETVDDLCASVKDIDNVNDMSVQDIIDLDHTLTELQHLISRGNKMIKAYHYKTIEEAVNATDETMKNLKTLSDKTNAKGNLRMRLNAGMADSYAFGRYAGNGTEQIIDGLSKAFEDKVSKVKQAVEFTQKVLEPYKKELKSWSKDTHEFTLSTTDRNGNPNKVKLTVGQMMELYLLNKREQARGHIYGGGIRVEDRKGRYTESVKVTEEDVQNILNYLSTVPGAMEVADKLQQYGATTITGWGNEASNLLYGYAKFLDENYWQIRSDNAALKDNENTEKAVNASMYRLQNLGRTKAVKKGANNAIYVGDVFDTWSKTIDEMTSYASILPATSDAMRWWNSRIVNEDGDAVRVKKLLESKLGTDMTKVFTETIKALNGGIMGTDSLESLVKTLTGKSKAAAVAGNLRVVLQQPTAYTRAAAVIEPKYLLKALTMKPAAEEAQEHSAIAWHKAQGFYSNGLAPSLRKLVIGDASIGENLTEKSLWLAGKADDITWGALWNASKLKVEEENKVLKKGSEEYWNEVNKVFSDIINNTQVVDTPLTKSTWMRGNGLGVFFTAFMAEPTKTYSMVMTSFENLLRDPKSQAARKAFAGVLTVFGVNAAVNAMAQALADAARDDDKELSYWEKYVKKYTEDIKDNLNPLTYIPVVKDVWSLWNGYSNTNLALQAPQNVIYAVQEIQKVAQGKSKKTLFGQMETIAKAISSCTGIPVGNVMRTFNSFGNVAGIDIFRRKKYTKSELGRNVVLSIKEGNTAEATEYWNQLVLEVGEDDISEAYGYISTYLAEHDENVDAYAVAFLEDANNLETQAEDLMRKYEYNEYITLDVCTDAIRKAAREDQKAEAEANKTKYKQTVSSTNSGGTIYNSSDVNRALEKGKIDEAQKIIDKINAGYKSQGSNSTAKSAVSNYWKPKYLAASGSERDAIAKMLYKLKNNGKQMFSAKDLQKWVSDANKKK